MFKSSIIAPTGQLGLQVVRAHRYDAEVSCSLGNIIRHAFPGFGLGAEVNIWRLKNMWRVLAGAVPIWTAKFLGVPSFHGTLYLMVRRKDGTVVQLGLAGLKVVTTAGVGFIVDAFQNIVEPELMKFHGLGTGATAEAVGDTALVTEITTQYATDNVRPTGTQVEGASANIYRTVGTITPDASVAATEHGIFSQAATGGGVLLDRTLFSVVNLASGDSLVATYEITFTAGS